MNDYKELIEELRENSCCYAYDDDCSFCGVKEKRECRKARVIIKNAADAIEQLVKERDAAVKCIEDIETYLQMGSAKYIDKTIKEWRGVQE